MIFMEGIKRRGNLEIGDRDNPPLPIFAETCWFSWTEQKFPLDRSISSLCFVEGRKWSIRHPQNRGKQQGFVGGEEETLSREIPPWLDTRRLDVEKAKGKREIWELENAREKYTFRIRDLMLLWRGERGGGENVSRPVLQNDETEQLWFAKFPTTKLEILLLRKFATHGWDN